MSVMLVDVVSWLLMILVVVGMLITHEGQVYMSHGRSLSLPGPHDTVDGAGVGPYLTIGSTIQLVRCMEVGCMVMV
jgi:hypothetical protein